MSLINSFLLNISEFFDDQANCFNVIN